jgi:putative membrane protein
MLFVSEAEKYVEIITDVAVAQKIDNALWEEAVQNFIERVKEGKIAQGYLETIQKAATLLTEHFPHAKAERDELPNHLILVD